jgi:hypothetical protein
MQFGTNVHQRLFDLVGKDDFLTSQIRIAPQGTSMPDFVHKVYDVSWEFTTVKAWPAHESRYPQDEWGPMIGILYQFK